jgi:hypothetical protein
MPKPFHELRECLLHAGIAPRYVRRYLRELNDHLADLRTEEVGAGRTAADAESAALARLGRVDDLAKAMIEQRQLQSWFARAPWAMFGVAPILALAAAWAVALFILWSGWLIFLPGATTPLGTRVYGFANLYFQFGKAIYFFAPILVGWGVGVLAARQRLKAIWPAVGLIPIALIGGASQVSADRIAVPGGFGHIRMSFALAPSVQGAYPFGLVHAAILLTITALPYLIWQLQRTYWRSA